MLLSCSGLQQKDICISKIIYLEEKSSVPLPPAIQIELKDFKNIFTEKIKTEKLKSIILSSNTSQNKTTIPFIQEIGFTVQFLKHKKIKLTAITYELRDTINKSDKSEIENYLNKSNIDFMFGNEILRIQKCN